MFVLMNFNTQTLFNSKSYGKLINVKTKNIFVVADDNQIISQWNDANPKWLYALKEEFAMESLRLPENYCCPAEVVEIANKLIAHNSDRYSEKKALTMNKNFENSHVLSIQSFKTFKDEAHWVASSIAERDPDSRSKCVILARTKKLLEEIVKALAEFSIQGYLATRKNEFQSPQLQWLYSILRLANSRMSQEHLRMVCKSFYTLTGIDPNVCDITSYASIEEGDYLRSWVKLVLYQNEIAESTKKLLEQGVLSMLADRLDFHNFQKMAFEWLDALPVTTPDQKGIFDVYKEEKETWHNLVNEISTCGDISLHHLLQELELRSKVPEPNKDAIPCYTFNASKGMKFDHVYLIGMVEEQFPSWMTIKKGDQRP